jgi:hypothetical protein
LREIEMMSHWGGSLRMLVGSIGVLDGLLEEVEKEEIRVMLMSKSRR